MFDSDVLIADDGTRAADEVYQCCSSEELLLQMVSVCSAENRTRPQRTGGLI